MRALDEHRTHYVGAGRNVPADVVGGVIWFMRPDNFRAAWAAAISLNPYWHGMDEESCDFWNEIACRAGIVFG